MKTSVNEFEFKVYYRKRFLAAILNDRLYQKSLR